MTGPREPSEARYDAANDRFVATCERALLAAAEAGQPLAVLEVSAETDAAVRERLGDAIADAVLAEVVGRLRESVRLDDIVARVGGNVFVVLLHPVIDEAAARGVAQRVIDHLCRPARISGRSVHLGCSVGMAVSTHVDGGIDALLAYAKRNLLRATRRGGKRVVGGTRVPDIPAAVALEPLLRRALHTEEFFLAYQPQVDLQTHEVVALEALLRWQRHEGPVVMPGDFIPALERTGLIIPVGAWIVGEACAQLRRWRDAFGGPRRIAINVSPRQLEDRRFIDIVRAALDDNQLEPAALEVELTEQLLLRESPRLERTIAGLHEMGVRLAIDDFGTGYSALAYLHRFPIDVLKLDRAMIQSIGGRGRAATIVAGIIDIAHRLGAEVVAEGVEIASEIAFLEAHGCDVAQGWAFGRPQREWRPVLAA